jgi:hypothetical protein
MLSNLVWHNIIETKETSRPLHRSREEIGRRRVENKVEQSLRLLQALPLRAYTKQGKYYIRYNKNNFKCPRAVNMSHSCTKADLCLPTFVRLASFFFLLRKSIKFGTL